MGRLSFFRETSLRFDEHYALTGNEDGHLWLRAKKLGARTGWAPDAYAYETVPPERLALRYQFTRSRDYTVTAFRAKLRSRPTATIMRIPGSLAARILTLIYCTAALPFEAGHSLVRMAWTLGAMFGIFRACLGGSSTHYVTVAGN